MRFQNRLPSLANVAAGGTATLICPLGLTYYCIQLVHNLADVTKLKNIEVVVNGKTIQTYKDGSQLRAINNYYNRIENAANILTLWFYRPEMATPMDRKLPALGTADIQTLNVRMDIDASVVSPTIEAYAIQGPQEPMGLITKIKSFPSAHSVAGKVELDNIVRAGRIAAMHLFSAVGVDAVEVDVNSRRVFEGSEELNADIQEKYGRAPQVGIASHVDFCLEGDIAEALITDGVFDFRLRPTLAAAGALNTVVEYLDGFAGI